MTTEAKLYTIRSAVDPALYVRELGRGATHLVALAPGRYDAKVYNTPEETTLPRVAGALRVPTWDLRAEPWVDPYPPVPREAVAPAEPPPRTVRDLLKTIEDNWDGSLSGAAALSELEEILTRHELLNLTQVPAGKMTTLEALRFLGVCSDSGDNEDNDY